MKWYQHDPNAALQGFACLTLEERGAYITILNLLYAQDGILIDDDAAIARLMHVQVRTWRPIKARLIAKGKIWVTAGQIMGKRVENTLRTADKLSEKLSKTAHKRWEKWRKDKEINGEVMRDSNATLLLNPNPHPERKKESKTLNGGAGSGEASGQPRKQPPRHGAFTKDHKRVWFNIGTPEWSQYADDYRSHHHGIDPPTQWDGAGSWFNWSGELQH
jgi:uncharacterized protein YdaU (DUF1376 family)